MDVEHICKFKPKLYMNDYCMGLYQIIWVLYQLKIYDGKNNPLWNIVKTSVVFMGNLLQNLLLRNHRTEPHPDSI